MSDSSKIQGPTIDKGTRLYFDTLNNQIKAAYSVAEKAREQGKDPEKKIDIPIAEDLAARVEGLVSMIFPDLMGSGLANGIRKLETEFGKNDEQVALYISEQVAKDEFCKFESLEKSLEAGVRVGVAYITLGVVTAPLEGITAVKIINNYVSIYYSGPIRSAGGTASAMSVIITDYVRRKLGIGDYVSEDIERKRYAVELEDYYRLVGMQYHPQDKEVEMIIKNVKICLDGDPTEKYEVSTHKGLPRVATDKIRGGMCLVVGEGLTLKAPKLLKRIKKIGKKFGLEDWLWLEDYNKLQKDIHSVKSKSDEDDGPKAKYTPSTKYVEKVIAGRPVIAHPGKPGGFRLRYGRSRTAGIAATSIHPATMHLTEFIAVGTQLATEYPGKATVCTPVDTVEGPVVLLKSGEVKNINTLEEVKAERKYVKTILSLGDILIPYGEFVSQGKILLPSAYCEEWWALEAKKAIEDGKSCESIELFTEKPFIKPDFKVALDISKKLNIPLHPAYNYFWHDLKKEELSRLVDMVSNGMYLKGILKIKNENIKTVLEHLCIPHKVDRTKEDSEMIVFEDAVADCLYTILGEPSKDNIKKHISLIEAESDVMNALNKLSPIKIKEKGLTRIGMKMGRPEKAERRIMKGRPHVLFPCGEEGGRMRNIMEAYKGGVVSAFLPTFRCPKCNKTVSFSICNFCGSKTREYRVCKTCSRSTSDKEHCGTPTLRYKSMKVDIKELVDGAVKNIGMAGLPALFKGVRGLSGKEKDLELLEKGLLRVKYELFVNKDGTTRFDATDMPMTHFKPYEINAPIELLKNIGYTEDVYGKPLVSDNQILELKVQDIILSDNPAFSGADYFIKICQFVDEVLVKIYGLTPYYNVSVKNDLIGLLVIGLAPHTSAGIVGRIIGFTPARVCYAHPFWHSAKRRNCDGDEDSILLLMDALLNFSRKFLPTTRGAATMDAPLVLTTNLNPEEVDDEAWNVDVDADYNLNFYEDTFEYKPPWEIRDKIKLVNDYIAKPEAYHSMFTHDTTNINDGPYRSKYVVLESMSEKIMAQLDLAVMISAVNASDVAERVLEKHFLKDIKGNLRTFSKQKVRCLSCAFKFRRMPLIGKCPMCEGKLLLTVHEGTIRKYVEPAKYLMDRFIITPYLMQQFAFLEFEIDSLFGKKARQLNLISFNKSKD
ncbi:MAG: DNA polymerase II large subunit [DPANN group archaeon]|nr:DNA polymerase II large subunit [DPANN group archaeon]